MGRKASLAIVIAALLGLSSLAFGQQTIGKKAHFTLNAPAQIGAVTLPAGDYEVRHRMLKNGHFMEFVRVSEMNLNYEGSPTYYEQEVVATVPCSLETLATKVAKTIVDKEGSRIARLEIKGETVVHNF